ncbi:MAG: ABC transporter permease [Tannerellaceae bacterium]|jgi:putative ABC transport system permease protein|nr:ABC transporter permease [Tannerellaceae bacterium]
MKQLYYTFRYVLRGKGSNLVKVISLTLGLTVALVLFSKVAFEASYDRHYPDADRIYRIQRNLSMGGDAVYDGPIINAPVPGAMKESLAGVEEAAVTQGWQETVLSYETVNYRENVLMADSAFFDLFGVSVLAGDKRQLAVASTIFLSRSAARRIFRQEDPAGKTLTLKSNGTPLIVAGVFEDVPENTTLRFDAVLSFRTLTQTWGARPGWMNNDAYIGYVKLRRGVTPAEVEAGIPDMLGNYYDVKAMEERGMWSSYLLHPVKDLHVKDPAVKKMLLILSLLAFVLLFVSAMNYVLNSISSLAVRAKSVGVHKCNGASGRNIFGLFMYETAVLILVSLALSVFLIYLFRAGIEELMQTSLAAIFSLPNLWVSLAVVAVLLLAAGVIPAMMFSSIPVTQLFRTCTPGRRNWKRSLLFAQFTGIAFVMALLVIIIRQYNYIMDKDLGYTTANILYSEGMEGVTGEQIALLKKELEQTPEVAAVSVAANLPLEGGNGWGIQDSEGNTLFSTRMVPVDQSYLKVFEIELIQGQAFPEDLTDSYTRVLVNESFVRNMGWTDAPVGKTINLSGLNVDVLGVVKDYQLSSLYAGKSGMFRDIPPLILAPNGSVYGSAGNRVMARLHHLDAGSLNLMNNRIKEVLSNQDAYFMDYQSRISLSYRSARLFRDSIWVAAGIMLFITILGLIGYTDDEMQRRSKEIAIRKINGATARNILSTITRDVSVTSAIAIVLGVTVSRIVGQQWLQQFAVKIPLNVFMFMLCGLFVFGIILFCSSARAWNIANENPANSLRSE